MLRFGLTGGIGCGKSSVARYFQQLGIVVIDADKIAKEVVAVGQPALEKIRQQFGDDALLENGELNRTWMRERVFVSADELNKLEAITHPEILLRLKAKMQELEDGGSSEYVIVDVPLLFEKGYEVLFAGVIVVDCSTEQQVTRVQQRDQSDADLISAIIAKQIDRTSRLNQASFVLDNTDSLENLYKQVERLHGQLLEQAKSLPGLPG